MNARLQELQLLNLKDAEELDRCCLDLWNRSAMKKQLKRMLLDVRKSNQTAIAFYEKNKFGIDGERKFYYGGKNPEDAILMSRMV